MKHFSLFSLAILACKAPSDPESIDTNLVGDSDRPAWNPDPQTISNESSSQNSIAWSPPDEEDYSVDHYRLLSKEVSTGKETEFEVSRSETEYTITGLKSDSEYEYIINACLDSDCSETVEIETNDDDAENNYWLLKTETEKWQFSQNSSRSNFQVAFLNAKDPSILAFENTDGFDGRALLSYTDVNTGNIHFGDIDLAITNPEAPLVVASHIDQGIFGGSFFSRFTSSQFKPYKHNGELKMMIFLSFQNSDDSTQIGSISNSGGFDTSFGGTSGGCSPFDGSDCFIQPCLDSEEESIRSLNAFHVTWESFGLENMGAEEVPSLVVEGFENIQDEGSIYYATMEDDESWAFVSDENNHPRKWIRNAKNASVLNYNRAQSKIYYQSAINNSLYLLYWHAEASGEANVYDFEDLEDSELARKIELVDSDGYGLPSTSAESIGNYHFFTSSIDQRQYIIYTILENNDPIGLGLAYLRNP